MAVFYDTHAHLDYPDFAPDFEQVIERAQQAGIQKIISIGTDLESSRRAIIGGGEFRFFAGQTMIVQSCLAERHDARVAA